MSRHLAAKLGIRRVLVPLRAGVLSALGLLLSPAAFDLKRTRKQPLDRLDPAAVRSEIGQMKQAIAERLAEAAPGARPDWVVTLEVGYIGQGYQVPVPVSDQQLAALTPASLLAAFAEVYRAKYGYYYDDVPAELVNILVAGQAGDMPAIISALPESAGTATPRGARPAWSPRRRERIEFAIYDRNALAPGMSFPGPAMIEEASATTVVDCDALVRIDRYGSIEITLPGGAAMTGRLPLEIIWPRLIAAADEMATTLFRTAFSHDVIEVHDMSTGLYDDRGNLIAQTYLGATGHVGVMPVIGKNLVRRFPRETIRPGDVFISNDPWVCNGQTADIFITMPAFHEDRLIGFSINSVHHVDIGGRKGSGLAEEVYEEGLIIPLMRLREAGRPNEVLLSLIERNVRFSDKVMGDLRAQMAAGWVGATGLSRIAADHKLGDLRKVADLIIAQTERSIRAGIAGLPDGTFTKSLPFEIGGTGEPGRIQLTLKIEGDRLTADFAGTSPAGAPPGQLADQLHPRLCRGADEDDLRSAAAEQRRHVPAELTLTAPEGCLVNPCYPAACFWRLASGMLVSELVFRILMRYRARTAPRPIPARCRPGSSTSTAPAERRSLGIAPACLRRHGRAARRRRARRRQLPVQCAQRLGRMVGIGNAGAVRAARADPQFGRRRAVARRSRRGARLPHRAVRRHRPAAADRAVGLGRADAVCAAGRGRRQGGLARLDRGQRPADRADQRPRSDVSPGRPGAA